MAYTLHLEIRSTADIVNARQRGRALAMQVGFSGSDLTVIATAISEVARNIVSHATHGEVTLLEIQRGSKHGICITASDERPELAASQREKRNGFSKLNGNGHKLPGDKWPVDNFTMRSRAGKGTRVSMQKWLD
jgi:serine/threonine-protein kinase RsbT